MAYTTSDFTWRGFARSSLNISKASAMYAGHSQVCLNLQLKLTLFFDTLSPHVKISTFSILSKKKKHWNCIVFDRVCGSKFFMGGHEEMKKVCLAKFQNFYYINPKKMGGHRPPRPPQFRTPWSKLSFGQ